MMKMLPQQECFQLALYWLSFPEDSFMMDCAALDTPVNDTKNDLAVCSSHIISSEHWLQFQVSLH